jgi:streptogrisin C
MRQWTALCCSRARRLFLAALMTAGLLTATFTAGPAARAQSSSSVDNPAVARLMADWGVSREEATARIARQLPIEDMAAALAKTFPNSYAGTWIDQVHGGRIEVASTTGHITVGYPQRFGLTGLVDERRVARSSAELQAISGAIAKQINVLNATGKYATSYIDPARNVVVLKVPPGLSPTGQQVLHRLVTSYGAGLSVVPGHLEAHTTACNAWACPPPLRGGVEIDILHSSSTYTICSSGFMGYVTSSGAKRLITAGHCYQSYSTQVYQANPTGTTNQPFWHLIGNESAHHFGGNVDGMTVTISDSSFWRPTYGWVYQHAFGCCSVPRNETFPIKSAALDSQIIDGIYVCHAGRTTGTTCGIIEFTNNTVNVDGVTMTDQFGYLACTQGGDSGGSVYDPGVSNGGAAKSRAYGLSNWVTDSVCTGSTISGGSTIQSIDNFFGLGLNFS